MEHIFTYKLSEEQLLAWESFFDSMETAAMEQHPLWASIEKGNFKYCFFEATENGKTICVASIIESGSRVFKNAHIKFGPLSQDAVLMTEAITIIHNHYEEQGFTYFTIQLLIPAGANADFIEYSLNKELNIEYSFDRENWSSIELDLAPTEEEIFKKFSKGHKSDIKKGYKNNMTVSVCESDHDLNSFLKIFAKMNKERGLGIHDPDNEEFLRRVYKFIQSKHKGKVLLVKDEHKTVIGGIIILFQGNTARYFKGASDSDYRNLPMLHLAIWEAITMSKRLGFKSFDFWGYNHYVAEDDQVFFINRFKKGFGGDFSFYAKKMYFIFKPVAYKLFKELKRVKSKWM